jgi:hypothetical protein
VKSPDDLIEQYLDELVAQLTPLGPRRLRQVLAETEAHLWDAVAEAVERGMNERDAQGQAIARFGPVDALVAAEYRSTSRSALTMLRQAVSSLWSLGAIVAVAVGVSGLVAALVRLVFGRTVLIDVAPNTVLLARDCARWLAGDPTAGSCRDAAIADWADEVVGYRVAVGVLGVLALLAYRLLRRRGSLVDVLPRAVSDTVAVTGFAVGALLTLVLGWSAVATAGGHGSGQWFSASIVALIAAVIFSVRLVSDLRQARATD